MNVSDGVTYSAWRIRYNFVIPEKAWPGSGYALEANPTLLSGTQYK